MDKYQYFKLGDLIELKKGQRVEPKEDGKYPIFGAGEKESGYSDTWNNDGRITIAKKELLARFTRENLNTAYLKQV